MSKPTDPFVHAVEVGWGDCDPARIAYTARLPDFALRAIEAWWRDRLGISWYEFNVDRNLGTPFVHMRLDFSAPVTPRYKLLCTVVPTRLGATSVAFRVAGEQNGRACFTGEFVSVFVTADAHEKRPPPDDIRALLETEIAASQRSVTA